MNEQQRFAAQAAVAVVTVVAFEVAVVAAARGGTVAKYLSDFGILAAVMVAAAACLHRAAGRAEESRRGWGLLGLACVLWALGQGIWTWYQLVSGRPVPFPSLADGAWVSAHLMLAAAVLGFHPAPGGVFTRVRPLLDGLIITASLLFVTWHAVLADVYESTEGSILAQALALAYPGTSIAIMAAVLVVAADAPAALRPSFLVLAASMLLLAVATGGYTILALDGEYRTGDPIDGMYVAAFLVLALAARTTTLAPASSPEGAETGGWPLSLLLNVPYLAAVPAVLVVIRKAAGHGGLGSFLTINGIVIVALVVVRHGMLLAEVRALHRRLEARVALRTAELAATEGRARRLAEQSQALLARYELALSAARMGTFEWNVSGGLVQWSPSLEASLGFAAGAFPRTVGAFQERVHPDDRDAVNDAIRNALRRKEITAIEFRMVRLDGTVAWVVARGQPSFDAAGEVTGLVGVTLDVTELRATQEELRRAHEGRRQLLGRTVDIQEEERRRIASGVHDDSIQKLVAAGLRLEVLESKLPPDPLLHEQAALVRHSIHLAIDSLRLLLFELRPAVLDLEGLEAALRVQLAQLFEGRDVACRVVSGLALEPPAATRTIVFRIAQEALANVHKHSKANSVRVELDGVDGGVRTRVVDNGKGFPVEATLAATPEPGHLGLTAIRERTEMAGGWHRIESTPGQGTTVEFWIPLDTAAVGGELDQPRAAWI